MASWRISELSSLTGVSVRMLRHFEKIGLLKPALRLKNEYRSYSEKDLVRLEQIIALRSFGFSLKEVKAMLEKEHSILAHLKAQRIRCQWLQVEGSKGCVFEIALVFSAHLLYLAALTKLKMGCLSDLR